MSKSYASCGVPGAITTRPGSFANQDSIIFAWNGPLLVLAPSGILTVIGQSAPHLQRSIAALLIKALYPRAAKPPN